METRQEHREREGERIELKRETAKAESKRLRWPGRAVTGACAGVLAAGTEAQEIRERSCGHVRSHRGTRSEGIAGGKRNQRCVLWRRCKLTGAADGVCLSGRPEKSGRGRKTKPLR